MLQVVTIETPGLGDRSYLVHDGRVGLVVDPQRDIDRALSAAGAAGVTITYVAETHLHNDYVSGRLELSRLLGIPYLVAAGEEGAFKPQTVADGDEVSTGAMRIRVVATPGHTRHHVSHVVDEPGAVPAVITGGSLLFGTVGLTDLIGPAEPDALTRSQYRSVRSCSSAKSSGAPRSSLGEDRRNNPAFTLDYEEAFVALLLGGLSAYPSDYAHMGPINRAGPAAIDLRPPPPMRAEDPFGDYLGWVLPWGAKLSLIGDAAEEMALGQRELVVVDVRRDDERARGHRRIWLRTSAESAHPDERVAPRRALGALRQRLSSRHRRKPP